MTTTDDLAAMSDDVAARLAGVWAEPEFRVGDRVVCVPSPECRAKLGLALSLGGEGFVHTEGHPATVHGATGTIFRDDPVGPEAEHRYFVALDHPVFNPQIGGPLESELLCAAELLPEEPRP